MNRVRALIIDDEPLAREGIRQLLSESSGVEITGEAGDGVQAVERIQTLKPDLVFLDIQMPGLDGFGVVRAVGTANMPEVIFITAFDEFALRAFDVHALDYLLKPIDAHRFGEAVARAMARLDSNAVSSINHKLVHLLEDISSPKKYVQRLAIKSSGKLSVVNTQDVDWIQADGDYVWIHSHGKKNLVREKIGDLQNKLNPQDFARIHRSCIVNLSRIKNLEPLFYGNYAVHLNDGTKLTLSRSYRETLFSLIKS